MVPDFKYIFWPIYLFWCSERCPRIINLITPSSLATDGQLRYAREDEASVQLSTATEPGPFPWHCWWWGHPLGILMAQPYIQTWDITGPWHVRFPWLADCMGLDLRVLSFLTQQVASRNHSVVPVVLFFAIASLFEKTVPSSQSFWLYIFVNISLMKATTYWVATLCHFLYVNSQKNLDMSVL